MSEGKEKNTRHKVRYGWRLWMTPSQAKETSGNDMDKGAERLLDVIFKGEKKDDLDS